MNKDQINETTFVGLDVVKKVGLDRIMKVVCEETGQTIEAVKGLTRKRETCTARHLYCYLATLAYGQYTLVNIGKKIGRDHASVLHAKRKIEDFLTWDLQTSETVNSLLNRLGRFTAFDVDSERITPQHVGYYNTADRKRALQLWSENNDVVTISNQINK